MYLLKTEKLFSSIGTFLLFFFFIIQQTNATTYYVDPSGSDGSGNGSASKPWKTLLHASWQVSKAGDIIYLKPGKYYEKGKIIHIKPGVSVKGAGIDKTTIFSDEDVAIIFLSQPVVNGNQKISDLTMNGENKTRNTGIRVEGRHNVTVERIKFINYKITGLDVSSFGASENSPPSAYLKGIKILNNTFINCAADLNGRSTGALQVGNMEGGEVAYNTINENTGYGLKFTAFGWFKSTKFHHNTINTPRSDKHWTSDIAIELWNLYDNCEVYSNITNNWFSFVRGNKGNGSRSVRIYDNQIIMPEVSGGNFMEAMEIWLSDVEIYNNYMENFREGIGIWGDIPLSNIKIYKNVMYSKYSEAKGVFIQPFKSLDFNNIEIYNNTIEVGWAGVSLRSRNNNFKMKNVKINNNLIIKAAHGVMSNGKGGSFRIENLKITHNDFHQVGSYFTEWSTNLVSSDYTKGKNMFVNPQLLLSGKRHGDYYDLKSGSDLIDAGINVGLTYQGSAPDCGGKEHEGGSTSNTNNPPIAKAGTDQTLTDGNGNGSEVVILNGSGSSDSDGTISSYQWSENGKVIATGVKPSVTLAVGTHEITLRVTDDDGSTGTDQVTIYISASGQGDEVVSFTLIDAITDQPISAYDPIPNGAAIDLTKLPHTALNIRANTNPSIVGSVVFKLTGAKNRSITESKAPYALFGDGGGNYESWVPVLGNYQLTATPYANSGGSGKIGKTKTISFSITKNISGSNAPPTAKAGADQTLTDGNGNGSEVVLLNGSGSNDNDGTISSYQWSENGKVIATGVKPSVTLAVGTHEITLRVTDDDGSTNTDQVTIHISSAAQVDGVVSFTLIDAITDQPISAYDPIPNGAAIDLSKLPHEEINIRANTNIVTISSVTFQLTGAATQSNTEGKAPYALFGDINGNYKSWDPKSGSYTLKATADLKDGNGQTKAITFSVINSAARFSQPALVAENSKTTSMWQSTENASYPSFTPKDNALEWMIGNASELENCRLQFVNRLGQLLYQINRPSVEDVKDLLGKFAHGKEYYYILQCGNKVVKSGGIIKAH